MNEQHSVEDGLPLVEESEQDYYDRYGTRVPRADAWEDGPCDCADCVTGPDLWCCRHCHSLAVGRVIPPASTQERAL